jgi:iron complex transport system ATP-binding protein
MFSIDCLRIETDDNVLLQSLSLTMLPAQRWVVLGANGCGKSSLLHACAGIPMAGRRVSFESMQLGTHTLQPAHVNPAILARLRSVCPQRLDWNTALTPAQLASLLKVTTSALNVPPAWHHQALSRRSGGEQQRIAMALTVGQSANVCFLDEPLTHLDEVQQVQALTMLKNSGKTVLMVSHHLRLSMSWASHALLAQGHGQWLQGPVHSVCSADNVAQAYDIPVAQARRLLLGELLFDGL